MTAHSTLRLSLGLPLVLSIAALFGCGGGGETPPVVANITAAAGGTVTSDDGQLQLIVAPNSASGDAAATIVKATPLAEMLATPGYVADSAYEYRGPDLDFDPSASWELASPHATLSAAINRKSALGARGTDPDVEQLCVAAVARAAGLGTKSVWVRGATCPAGCTALRAPGAPAVAGRTLCAPADELQVGTRDVACPAGTSDVSAEPAWSTWTTTNSARLCVDAPARGAPVLGTSAAAATTSCAVRAGKFVCDPPKVTSGTYIGLFELDPDPPTVKLRFQANWTDATAPDRLIDGAFTILVPDGTTGKLYFAPTADDSEGHASGIAGVQILEHKVVTPSFGGPALIALVGSVVWNAPHPFNLDDTKPNTFSTPVPAIVDYKWNDPPVRYFRGKAWDKAGNVAYTPFLRISRLSPSAPVVIGFAAAPAALPLGGGVTTLSWGVSGADTVSIVPGPGSVASNGSALAVVNATTTFTLTASNTYGQTTTAHAVVTVDADTTPPVVTLASSAATVVVPSGVTLTATASDAVGVAKVEFLRGATVIATDFTAPYQHSVALGAADVGAITFRARAYDAAGNVSPTSGVVVTVTDPPGNGDTYAGPTGVDIGNTTCAQATPCLTIAKAASLAQANKTVWLLNGDYTGATQPAPIQIPSGLTLRAVNAGLARVGQGIVLQGNGSVVGIVLRRFDFGDIGWIEASSGTVAIDGVRVIGSAQAPSGFAAAIAVSGNAHATMTPGAIADYTDQLTAAGQGTATYATVGGSARLTVSGGTFGGAALGGADGVNGSVGRGAFILTGNGRLDLDNVVVNVDSSGVSMFGAATQLYMTGSTLRSNVNTGAGAGIHAALGSPQITIVNSTISGFSNSYSGSSAGVVVGTFGQPGVAATIAVGSAALSGNDTGIAVRSGSTSAGSLLLSGSNLALTGNIFGGLVCSDACNVDLAGGEVSGNGTSDASIAGGHNFFGGIWLGSTGKSYFLKLRNVQVTGNKSLSTGNSNQSSNSGVTLAGSATSIFDLGTAASPGNNVFTGNTTGSETTGLNVAVAPGIVVRSVGNTFIAGVQGADGLGKYQLGTAPCGPSSCDLTSTASSGANFRIASGALRLAE